MRPRLSLSHSLAPTPLVALASLLAAIGCATQPGAVHSAASQSASASSSSSSSSSSSTGAPPAIGARVPAASGRATFLPRLPEIKLDPKEPLRALPELKVENIGLHVGGGPNDADTKAPFQRAIAERFPAFLECYRKNDDPAKGGRFGIDLHIARTGGHPRVEQPRTAMRGPAFRACVSATFESVEFERPKRGPTTISYSLHFTVGEAP